MAYSLCLQAQVKAGMIKSFDYERGFPIYANGVYICTHKPDFIIFDKDGKWWIEEVKGVRTAVFNLKLKLFMAQYPGVKYRIC